MLVDPANGLSEKPLQKGSSWLKGEIDRARQKPDQVRSRQHRRPLTANADVLVSRRASDIQPEAIRWLWPQRIALGKLSLIAGPPGLGKSQLTAYVAAIISTGGTWPTGETCQAGDVLILSAEDDPADTILPRLDACAARLDRILIFDAMKKKNSKGERTFDHVILMTGCNQWDQGLDVVVEGRRYGSPTIRSSYGLPKPGPRSGTDSGSSTPAMAPFTTRPATALVYAVRPEKVLAFGKGTFSHTSHRFPTKIG